MKSILTLICAVFLWFPLQAKEKIYTVDNLPKVHLQNKMKSVCNPEGILSQAACDTIDARLYALERQPGIETVVAVGSFFSDAGCVCFSPHFLHRRCVGE